MKFGNLTFWLVIVLNVLILIGALRTATVTGGKLEGMKENAQTIARPEVLDSPKIQASPPEARELLADLQNLATSSMSATISGAETLYRSSNTVAICAFINLMMFGWNWRKLKT